MKLVITGHPNTGKTTLTRILEHQFPNDVAVMPDILDLINLEEIPQAKSPRGQRALQRALYFFQRELETLMEDNSPGKLVICDHGTLDYLSGWPDSAQSFFDEVHTDLKAELARYDCVLQIQREGHSLDDLPAPSSLNPQLFWNQHPMRISISLKEGFSSCISHSAKIVEQLIKKNVVPHIPSKPIDTKQSITEKGDFI